MVQVTEQWASQITSILLGTLAHAQYHIIPHLSQQLNVEGFWEDRITIHSTVLFFLPPNALDGASSFSQLAQKGYDTHAIQYLYSILQLYL